MAGNLAASLTLPQAASPASPKATPSATMDFTDILSAWGTESPMGGSTRHMAKTVASTCRKNQPPKRYKAEKPRFPGALRVTGEIGPALFSQSLAFQMSGKLADTPTMAF